MTRWLRVIGGHLLSPDDIYSLLLAEGRNGLLAEEMRTLIAEANDGKRHMIRNKAYEVGYDCYANFRNNPRVTNERQGFRPDDITRCYPKAREWSPTPSPKLRNG